jgi:MraZ protein
MDAKNRVTVPSEWLSEEGDVFFVLPAKNNLSVMPAGELALQEEKINSLIPAGLARQEALRRIYSSAQKVEPDKQGRILLPEKYCTRVDLSGEVVFVGVKGRFEIWNAAKWSIVASQEPELLSEEARKALEALGL